MIRFIKTVLYAGIPLGLAAGAGMVWVYGQLDGMFAGLAGGLLFGVGMASFQHIQQKRLEITDGDVDGEPIVMQSGANHRLGGEHRGGWLVLTRRRLLFRPHFFNLQRASVEIPVEEIESVEESRALGIIPNRFCVRCTDGSEEMLTVSGRDEWLARLEEVVESADS